VRITRARERWAATLALTASGVRSTRRLAGASCLEVSEAAAFVTAVVVDPGVLARPETPPPPPEVTTPEPTVPPPPDVGVPEPVVLPPPPPEPVAPLPAPPPALRPARPPRPGGFVRVTGGLEALGLPRVGAQVAVTTGLLGRKWRVEVGGMYRAPTPTYSELVPQAGAWIRLWTVSARGCGVLRQRALEIPLCAGVEAGEAIADGFGYEGAKRGRNPWFAGVIAPAVAWAPRRWLALWIGGELAIPLRGGYRIRGLGRLFTIGAVSLRVSAGVELRFF
jgi:hypothetical protein